MGRGRVAAHSAPKVEPPSRIARMARLSSAAAAAAAHKQIHPVDGHAQFRPPLVSGSTGPGADVFSAPLGRPRCWPSGAQKQPSALLLLLFHILQSAHLPQHSSRRWRPSLVAAANGRRLYVWRSPKWAPDSNCWSLFGAAPTHSSMLIVTLVRFARRLVSSIQSSLGVAISDRRPKVGQSVLLCV